MNKVELWRQEIDVSFVGIDLCDTASKYYHLCPYGTDKLKEAFSHKAMQKRIKLIDSTILRLMGV